jgi:putative two-component system response regulator
MRSKNVITHIQDVDARYKLSHVFKEQGLIELRIDDYEEFFHALIHVRPYLFIVEINSLDDPYVKVIQIIKKSVLTRSVPIMVISQAKEEALYDELARHDLVSIIQGPYHQGVFDVEVRQAVNMIQSKLMLDTTQDLQAVQTVMISGLASLAEYRDPETGEHIKRTQNYVKALAITLKRKGLFTEELTTENIESIYMSVPLHDIGKIGIRDEILLKAGRLNKEEFEEMKTHTTLGYEAIIKVGIQGA